MPGVRTQERKSAPAPASPGPAPASNDSLSDPLQGSIANKPADSGLAAASRPLDTSGDAARFKGGKVETQSSKHMWVLYEQAAHAMLGLGRETTNVAAASRGNARLCPELKGRERALQKVQADYGGHPEKLMDLARASIVYDDAESLEKGVEIVRAMDVVREKNNFETPNGGYRDYNFNIRIEGHICELQLHLSQIMDAKKKGHKHYNVVRDIEAQQKEHGGPLTEADTNKKENAQGSMWKLYNDAYAAAGGQVTPAQREKEPKKP